MKIVISFIAGPLANIVNICLAFNQYIQVLKGAIKVALGN